MSDFPVIGDPSGPLGDGGGGIDQILLQDIVAAIEQIVAWIIALVEWLWAVIVAVANFLWQILYDLGTFFYRLWDLYIYPWLKAAAAELQALWGSIVGTLDPIFKWIARIQKWYNTYIRPWVTLAQNILSRIRLVLGLLKLLNVKWAAQLDATFAQIQSWVTTFTNDIVQTLNAITSVLSLVVDPFQIIRRDFFAGSLFSSLAGVKRAAGYGTDRSSTPYETTQVGQNNGAVWSGQPVVSYDASGNRTASAPIAAIDASFVTQKAQLAILAYPA